jgi:hypothetical protein
MSPSYDDWKTTEPEFNDGPEECIECGGPLDTDRLRCAPCRGEDLEDEDGIDGPAERAWERAMDEDDNIDDAWGQSRDDYDNIRDGGRLCPEQLAERRQMGGCGD